MSSLPVRLCSIEGCERKHQAQGLCNTHYKRAKHQGKLANIRDPSKTVEERFWDRVDKNGPPHPDLKTPCWLWIGALDRDGYGLFGPEVGANHRAHRFSYTLAKGEIPEGLQLDHLCKVRNCVNPEHCEPVTGKENTLRGDGITARNAQKTHCPKGHPYDILGTYPNGGSFRGCKRCNREKTQRYRDKRKGG